jgi:hypothetical protein
VQETFLTVKVMQIIKNSILKAGNHLVSIGRDGHQVAIQSLHTGEWVDLKRSKTNKRLRKIKREFKLWLVCDKQFFFERMSTENTIRLIEILKGK